MLRVSDPIEEVVYFVPEDTARDRYCVSLRIRDVTQAQRNLHGFSRVPHLRSIRFVPQSCPDLVLIQDISISSNDSS